MPPRYRGTSCRGLSLSLEVEIYPPPKALGTKLLGRKERRAFLEVNKEQTDARSKLTDLGLPPGASCPLICHGRTQRQGALSPLLQSVFLPFPFSLHHLSPRLTDSTNPPQPLTAVSTGAASPKQLGPVVVMSLLPSLNLKSCYGVSLLLR